MWKFLFLGLAVFVLWKMLTGDFKQKKKQEPPREVQPTQSEMVKDPVCGSYVSTSASVRFFANGREHHFCSEECKEAFVRRIEAADASQPKREGA